MSYLEKSYWEEEETMMYCSHCGKDTEAKISASCDILGGWTVEVEIDMSCAVCGQPAGVGRSTIVTLGG